MQRDGINTYNLSVYTPAAVYYEEADRLEYVRRDIPSVYRRIDSLLTLILSMETREPLGFQIKGFKNFYLRRLAAKQETEKLEFLTLMVIIEEALSDLGDDLFNTDERAKAYEAALEIATEDNIALTELPAVA